jgi:hypothetical protein
MTNWLSEYLDGVVGRDLCTRIGCTTCGASDFRSGVWSALARSKGRAQPSTTSRTEILEMAKALAQVPPPRDPSGRVEEAARCLIFDLWSGIPFLDWELEGALAGSWAGGVLASMQRHHAARQAAHRQSTIEEAQRAQQAEYMRRRRGELHAERQAQRAARKKERDRILMGGLVEDGGAK